MARQVPVLLGFNRGKVSPLALGRVDQKRVAMSAETFTNYIPRVLGPMSLRPGLKYLCATHNNNATRYIPFVFATTDTGLIELTDGAMRVLLSDAPITRAAVTAQVVNPNFTSDINSWTDNDEAGATSAWVAGGYMGLTGGGTTAAIRDQVVTVNEPGTEHALRISVYRGPVTLRVGMTAGSDEYIAETSLGTGDHSLSFVPTGDFNIRFMSRVRRIVLVNSCSVESAGIMVVVSPYLEADIGEIRYEQSGDVVFLSHGAYQQRMIERRGTRSWSMVIYAPNDGPIGLDNVTPTTLTAAALYGNTTMTASTPVFISTDVGRLIRHVSVGQRVSSSLSAEDTWTDVIRVTGVGASQRTFTINSTGTWVGTIRIQSSLDSDAGPWTDVTAKYWTANTTNTHNDGLDNQIVYYRFGFKLAEYTSGTAVCTLTYAFGSNVGYGRITGYTSSTVVDVEVLEDFGGITATTTWSLGEWSDTTGWPSAVRIHEGRLWWCGNNGIFGSISDAYDGFDPDFEGDAGPIQRTIGSGAVDQISWMLSLQRMIIGAQGAEYSVKASSLDELLTPSNFNMKAASTIGSRSVEPARIDQRAVYVQRGGQRVYELSFNIQSAYDYDSKNLTAICPEIGYPGIVRLGALRQPDTRIHCIKSDGTAIIAVYDPVEEVIAWVDITTDGLIEDVVCLPGEEGEVNDRCYYVVKRTINGSDVRYLERWADEEECRGADLNLQADSYVVYTGAATTTITGLDHLEGESVVVWADGEDVGTDDSTTTWTQTYTVSGGQIVLATAASNVVVGLPYEALWKSTKLGLQANEGMTTVNQDKKLNYVGVLGAWLHRKGIRFGPDFTNMDDMPEIEQGVAPDEVRTTYDEGEIEFPGTWTTDLRICIKSAAPRPATILGIVTDLTIA